MRKRLALFFMLVAPTLAVEAPRADWTVDGIRLGESQAQVEQAWGEPNGVTHRGAEVILSWGQSTIAFVEHRAISVSGIQLTAGSLTVRQGDPVSKLDPLGDSTELAYHAFAPELGGPQSLRRFHLNGLDLSVWLDRDQRVTLISLSESP